MIEELTVLQAGQPIVFGGNRVTRVSAELAAAFTEGDRLVVVADTGDLLHIPAAEWETATVAVGRAHAAFGRLGAVSDDAISAFYRAFAARLADDEQFAPIVAANQGDIESARKRGRSTTRLELTSIMRADMIGGLRMWADATSARDQVLDVIDHEGWRVEQRVAGLGVVGFVFEGRPNVFADACGVLRSGNAVVFRIGSDALTTAKAIVEHALDPALAAAGLPDGAATLVESPAHAAGWAMFSDPRLSLAVARGSGPAVAQLGAVARQVGTSVSLHGTGGAWIVAGRSCNPDRLRTVVRNSLDRKVCNTLNTCVVLRSLASELVPVVLGGLEGAAAARGTNPKLHVTPPTEEFIPSTWFDRKVAISRASGEEIEPLAELIGHDQLGVEWEWEASPEMTITIVDTVDEAVELFNQQSPRFAASLISDDESEQQQFWATIDAPFVGDGFTRWVDGQYALNKPELGLSNWQGGRLFGRGGVLSGDSVYTVRAWARQPDPDVCR
ncbi:MAG: aldehyde dehydrogenase family protein [Actinomycetia bacterium]|nr:aldehyde dehydrogenase family protein [Actinomycetes bacterium]MCP5030445.1 aldehyde dehydrogenase family protein [Actinomycetes bacterium]